MRLSAFIALGFFVSVPALAVTVDPLQGEVTINRGDGVFRPVIGTLEGDIGDSVMVRPGGTARVVYDDGCTVDVNPGDIHTITGLSPCKAPTPAPSDAPPDYSAVGTVAVGGGVVAAIILLLLNNKNDDTPASP